MYTRRRAYAAFMGTRPQTLYGLADSPVGLAAWLLDHGDGWGQPAPPVTSAVLGYTSHGHPAGDLTRDDVLDNITLYWLTGTAVSSARLYWENKFSLYNDADVSVPAAVSVFPGENYQAPRSWAERAYHNLIYFNEVDKGGHFAAWEQPQLFSEEVRAGFRPLRDDFGTRQPTSQGRRDLDHLRQCVRWQDDAARLLAQRLRAPHRSMATRCTTVRVWLQVAGSR